MSGDANDVRRPAPRVDWALVLGDFVYLGLTGAALADRLCMRPALLRRISAGELPKGAHAHRIVALWCDMTGKPARFVPMTTQDAARQPVEGLMSDADHELPFVALQAAFMIWGRQAR